LYNESNENGLTERRTALLGSVKQEIGSSLAYIPQSFAIVERILRSRTAHFADTHEKEALPGLIGKLSVVTVAGFAVFGFVLGLSGGNLAQAVASALKLPFLFVASGLICLPTLYQFSVLFGSPLRFLQTWALILTAQAVSAALALGFAPIILLFWASGTDPLLLVTLNAAALGLCAAVGLIFLVQGVLCVQERDPPTKISFFGWIGMYFRGTFRSLVLTAWLFVYGVVGAQMSWALRPFFGVPLHGRGFLNSVYNLILNLLEW
jgi:hypothetical protein